MKCVCSKQLAIAGQMWSRFWVCRRLVQGWGPWGPKLGGAGWVLKQPAEGRKRQGQRDLWLRQRAVWPGHPASPSLAPTHFRFPNNIPTPGVPALCDSELILLGCPGLAPTPSGQCKGEFVTHVWARGHGNSYAHSRSAGSSQQNSKRVPACLASCGQLHSQFSSSPAPAHQVA